MDRYIIGCGPNGREGYHLIPKDAPKILLNAAINWACEFRWADFIWMISDWKCTESVWFKNWYHYFNHILHGSGKVAGKVEVAVEWQEDPWMTLPDFWEKDKTPDVKPIEGVYRGGASVVGCALHRCAWEFENPILCGIDMEGDNEVAGFAYESGHWDVKIELLDALIKYYIPQTRTLTETKLEVRNV